MPSDSKSTETPESACNYYVSVVLQFYFVRNISYYVLKKKKKKKKCWQ